MCEDDSFSPSGKTENRTSTSHHNPHPAPSASSATSYTNPDRQHFTYGNPASGARPRIQGNVFDSDSESNNLDN